jgi:hypothetical protein
MNEPAISHTEISCKREQNHQVYFNVMPSAAEILRRRQNQQKNSKAMYRQICTGKITNMTPKGILK